MSKYYIPTSTRNFTNILSSESISPKAFYELRGFGISYWQEIPENALDNTITLYNHPFVFNRPQSDYEDQPMFVEIDTDEKFLEICNGVYSCNHSIYLSPFNTRFIFFTEEDRRKMLSLSDNMSEVKFRSLYNECFVVEKYTNSSINTLANNDVELNKIEIECDRRINKMKGLLYGYYIGAMFSTPEPFIRKYNILSGLQDLYYAIISSVNRQPTASQKEKIELLMTELWKMEQNYPTTVPTTQKIIVSLSTDDNYTKNWLKSEMDRLNDNIMKKRSLLKVSDKEVIIKDLALTTLSCISDIQEKNIVKTWVNNVFIDRYDDNISSDNQKELSDKVTQQAKEILGEKWENSKIRESLNEMRRFIRELDNGLKWDNYIVSSVTAVIEKGNDWETLLAFMKRKSMCDYRLAFALYGELHGYANLTRDFTDLLFYESKEYVGEIYIEFYRQLFGKDIPANTPSLVTSEEKALQNSDENVYNNDVREMILHNAKSVFKRYKNKKDLLKDVEEISLKAVSIVEFFNILKQNNLWKTQNGKPTKEWKKLKESVENMHTNKLHTKKESVKQDTAEQPSLFDNIKEEKVYFAQNVRETFTGKNDNHAEKKVNDRICEELCSRTIIPSVSVDKRNIRSITATSVNFVDDENVANFIMTRTYLSTSLREILAKKVTSFQKDYAPNGYYRKKDSPRTNDNTINHFVQRCTFVNGKKGFWISPTPENKALLEKLKKELYERYANR